MRKLVLSGVAILGLATVTACGDTGAERGLSGAAIGAGGGAAAAAIIGGSVGAGALIGAGVGAATGILTKDNK